jgi:hypothetical protein
MKKPLLGFGLELAAPAGKLLVYYLTKRLIGTGENF